MQRTPRWYVLAAFLSLTRLAGAQVNPGIPSFSASESHAVDTINLQNLNISLNIPVVSKNGAIPFRFGMSANSYVSSSSGLWHASLQANPLIWSTGGFLSINTALVMYSTNNTLAAR